MFAIFNEFMKIIQVYFKVYKRLNSYKLLYDTGSSSIVWFWMFQNHFYAGFVNKCGRFAQISVITVERGALEWQEKP